MSGKRRALTDLQPVPAPPPLPPAPPRRQEPVPPVVPEERALYGPGAAPPASRAPEPQSPAPSRPARRREPDIQPPGLRTPGVRTPELPKYLRLERKEFLAWPEQLTRLSILARVLNRNRGGAGERITVNTLIRVFVEFGLSHEQELGGVTEDELRRSLGLP